MRLLYNFPVLFTITERVKWILTNYLISSKVKKVGADISFCEYRCLQETRIVAYVKYLFSVDKYFNTFLLRVNNEQERCH